MADILLVDMQSFYASVEKAEAPHLKNRPVIVSGDPERRSGVVLAACPLAKRYGVKNAERLWEAQAKCPDAVIVRPRMQRYIDVSVMITELFERYTDLVEPYSIDEQFLDVTGSRRLFGDPFTIAKSIQQAIMREFGIYARVGIGPNKALAKMACDHFAKKKRIRHPQIGYVKYQAGSVAAAGRKIIRHRKTDGASFKTDGHQHNRRACRAPSRTAEKTLGH